MFPRVILAFACAAVLCAAQTESTPPTPQPSSSTAAKEIVSPSQATAPATEAPSQAAAQENTTPAASGKPGPQTSSTDPKDSGAPATNSPVIDVPPTRKTSAPDAANKSASAAPKSGKTGPAAPGKPTDAPYVIGPLDVLGINVWGQPNLSHPVDVAADGNISLPLINDVKADGLTREELKTELTKRLSEFINNPEVDVQVLKVNSKFYFVYGGVGRPGEFPLVKPTTMMDAVSTFGGFSSFANRKKIRIQRTLSSGQIQEFKFDYNAVSKGKNMEQNIYLQSGDRIFVPE